MTNLEEPTLTTILTERAQTFDQYCQASKQAKAELAEGARLARKAGWSAQRIASMVGVSKRTIQVWTD